MLPSSAYLLFTLGFAGTPGSSTALVAQASSWGRARGGWTLLGVASGNLFWGLLCSAGVGQILLAQPILLQYLTISGALILVALALRPSKSTGSLSTREERGKGEDYLVGFLASLSNVSILIFYVTIVPGFACPSSNLAQGTIGAGAVSAPLLIHNLCYVGVAFCIHACYVLGISRLGEGRPAGRSSTLAIDVLARAGLLALSVVLLWRAFQ